MQTSPILHVQLVLAGVEKYDVSHTDAEKAKVTEDFVILLYQYKERFRSLSDSGFRWLETRWAPVPLLKLSE